MCCSSFLKVMMFIFNGSIFVSWNFCVVPQENSLHRQYCSKSANCFFVVWYSLPVLLYNGMWKKTHNSWLVDLLRGVVRWFFKCTVLLTDNQKGRYNSCLYAKHEATARAGIAQLSIKTGNRGRELASSKLTESQTFKAVQSFVLL